MFLLGKGWPGEQAYEVFLQGAPSLMRLNCVLLCVSDGGLCEWAGGVDGEDEEASGGGRGGLAGGDGHTIREGEGGEPPCRLWRYRYMQDIRIIFY